MDISAIYKHPEDVVAVTSSSGSITYGELYRRSENLAKHIIASGAKRVIVYGHKEYAISYKKSTLFSMPFTVAFFAALR